MGSARGLSSTKGGFPTIGHCIRVFFKCSQIYIFIENNLALPEKLTGYSVVTMTLCFGHNMQHCFSIQPTGRYPASKSRDDDNDDGEFMSLYNSFMHP